MISRSRQILKLIDAAVAPISSTASYRPDIDGLRAISILAVILFHAFPSFLPGGFVGVDVFFVISGYLITSIVVRNVRSGTFSFGQFYANRVRRLFPALGLVLVAVLTFGWFEFLPEEFAALSKHVAAGAAFIANFALWDESGYFDTAARLKPLLHLWSLGIEEQFYLVWPALVLVTARWKLGVAWCAGTVFVLSLLANLLGVHYGRIEHDAVATFYAPYTRFWELMAGALMSPFVISWSPARYTRSSDVASWLGVGLIVVASATFTDKMYYPGGAGLVPVIGACLIIGAGSGAAANRWLGTRPFVWLGAISYPLYLWHWPLLVLAPYVMGDLSVPERVCVVALAVLLAWFTYALFESPYDSAPIEQ